MHIVGTAGHVDHGKSSLVTALTGVNPDRWLEEQVRGMTLDLGFAHLRLDDGLEAGIVDVPGHARFLHNMLAGASGMELLLLVVAADEGVMPQTVEHLQILQYLNARAAIVVVTKIDTVADADREAAFERIGTALQGTIAAEAPFVATSIRTGEGIAELRREIEAALRALPPRALDAPAYLPVDRVFTLPGRGTILTGTLMQGQIASGDTIAIAPNALSARVRTIHVFGSPLERASAGMRVALNVPSIPRSDVSRGDVVSAPGIDPQSNFRVRFTPHADALASMRRRNPVRAYIGAAEVLGTLVFERAPESATEHTAELFLRRPVLAFPGVRFVARRVSPKSLLGGGTIDAAHGGAAPAGDTPAALEAVLDVLRSAELRAFDARKVAFAANLREEVASLALEAAVERQEALKIARPAEYVDMHAAATLLDHALGALAEAHRTEPWSMGVTSIVLARTLGVSESLLVRILNAFADDGRVANRAGYYSTLDHQPNLTPEQRSFFESAVPLDAASPFLPASLAETLRAVKESRVAGVAKAFDTLVARGALVKVGDAIYRGTQMAQIHANVEEYIRTNGRMTMAEFRDLLGTSRKFAVPLLEWFDSRAITVRSGDVRMLRKK